MEERGIARLVSRASPRGGTAVRNLPQFTAFFSDASIPKFHLSPQENSFPTFAVTRHNVRFSVFVFPKCHPLLGTVILAMVKD